MNLAESIRSGINTYDEHSLRVLADCLPQLIWTCDQDGLCDFASRRWHDYTGVEFAHAASLSWLPLVHAADRSALMTAWNEAQQSQEPLRIELRLRRFDGIHRSFDLQLARVTARGAQISKWLVSATDIQDSVDARNELLRGHRHLREVFDRAPVAITLEDWRFVRLELKRLKQLGEIDVAQYLDTHPRWVDDLLDSIKILDANDAAVSLLRASSREQLVGNSLQRLFKGPARAEFINVISLLAAQQYPANGPRALCALDGTQLMTLMSSVERAPETDPGLALVTRVDVTDHYRNQEEVQRQRNMLEQVGRLAKVGGWMRDLVTEDRYFTSEFARIHGLPENDPASLMNAFGLYNAADQEFVRAGILHAALNNESFIFEREILTADQQRRWVRAKVLPVAQDGKLVRVEGAVQDITDRKHAELEIQSLNARLESQVVERTRELEQARHDLQNILDAMPTMVVSYDADLHLRFANRAYLARMGLSAELARGMHAKTLIRHAERFKKLQLALQGAAQEFEDWFAAPIGNGAIRGKTYYRPDIIDGVVRGVYAFIVDITKLTQAEEGLRAANRELEAFAYAVAHDLRSPLRAMSGFSSALLEDHGKALPDEARDFAMEINKGSRRMGELLDGLLSLSRSTQGAMHLNRVDLSAMAQSLLNELKRQDPHRSVACRIAPDLIAYGDARMLELVMRNLLGNAWKYTSRTPSAVIMVDALTHDAIRQFRVIDNGAGFDMAHVEQLFKPFQRLHRQEEFAGIGIGLATANRIINRHGGVMTAEGAPGQGAKFCFTLGGQSAEGTT